jgi:tetratricopeptide (TPR) repeat protein
MKDVELRAPVAEESESECTSGLGVKLLTAEANEVERYAATAIDNIFGSLTDALAQISPAFDGSGDNEGGSDVDVLTLLAVLVISKLGVLFSIGIDWALFSDVFGWLNQLSILAPHVPNVGQTIVKTVTFVLLLLLQPLCLGRMYWLAREQRGDLALPLPIIASWLPRIVRTKLIPFHSIFTPLTMLLWLLFWVIFTPAMVTKSHMLAGFVCLFFGFPAFYLTFVNYVRQKTWEYVYLRYADVVRVRHYENLCLREGSFVLFLFVATYSFVINFFVALIAAWDTQTGTQNAALVIGFILYSMLPLYYLFQLITDINSDRTFRIFREQLGMLTSFTIPLSIFMVIYLFIFVNLQYTLPTVSPFVDQHMYMRLVLLIESALFSLVILLGNDTTLQLIGGSVVSIVFFVVALGSRPYEQDMENYSDIIARSSICATLMLGLVIQGAGSSSSIGIDVVLILIFSMTTIWFLYTMDIKEILLSRLFLLLQLYAQAKAMRYTKEKIKKMTPERIRRIANSPIEFHVLSAVQRIHFATLRKADFFYGGKRIKVLADLGVTWLDLQQMDCTCASLRALGFSSDELMNVDAQLDDMGDRSDIQTLYEDVYLERKRSLGENDRITLAAMQQLASLYRDMGEHVKGMDYAKSCYKQRVTLFGPEDEDSLTSQLFIGEYYVQLDRASDGLEYLHSCYSVRFKTSKDSEETLDSARALGKCYLALGMTSEALNILEKRYIAVVTQTMADKLRRDHPRTLSCRLDFANALIDSGRFTSVETLQLHAIMNRQKTIYGADDPGTLKFMDRYAELCIKMGAYKQALVLNIDAVSEKTATLGPNHTGTIASKFALANTYISLGRNVEVQQLKLEDCLNNQVTRLGETHPSTITSKVKLAVLYHEMTQHEQSLALFKTVYEVRCKSLGKEHELTLGMANNIAGVLDSMQRYQESQDMYESTLAISIARLGKAHLDTTGVLLNLGQLYQRIGNLEKARHFYKDTFELCLEAYGEKHPRTLLALDFIGCLALVEERWHDAKVIFERGMELRKDMYEDSHPLCLTNMENLASSMQRLGFKQEVIPIYQKLVKLRETGYGMRHIDTIKVRVGMAIVLAELGQVQQALSIMVVSVQDTSAVLGPAAAQVQEYIGVTGYIQGLCGNWDDAIRNTNIALSGTIKIFGENHFLVKSILQRKVWMLQSAGRITEANQVTAIMNTIPATGVSVGASSSNAVNE